jgi:hypothetical protein
VFHIKQRKNWKRRYFMLDTLALNYYANHQVCSWPACGCTFELEIERYFCETAFHLLPQEIFDIKSGPASDLW